VESENTLYIGTASGGSNGYFGPPDGLGDMNNGDFLLELDRTAHTPFNLTLVITHFIDNQLYSDENSAEGMELADKAVCALARRDDFCIERGWLSGAFAYVFRGFFDNRNVLLQSV
jgi:hypothetical protein